MSLPNVPFRFESSNDGCVDEFVIGYRFQCPEDHNDGGIHLECLDTGVLWVAIDKPGGERWSFTLTFHPSGRLEHVTMTEEPWEEPPALGHAGAGLRPSGREDSEAEGRPSIQTEASQVSNESTGGGE